MTSMTTRARWLMVVLAALLTSATAAVLVTRSAAAQAGFRECFAARLYSVSTNDLNSGSVPTTARIPSGWTVVGGGQGGTDPAVVLCR